MSHRYVILLLSLLILFLIPSCCIHKWVDADCTHPRTCSKCGETEGEALGHMWDDGTRKEPGCTEDGSLTYTCLRCGEKRIENIAATGHDWTGSVEKDATCTEDGVEKYTCSRCAESYETVIPARGHERMLTVKRKSTCTLEGIERISCAVCGAYLGEEPMPLAEHDLSDIEVLRESTCSETGLGYYRCLNCRFSKYVTLALKAHSEEKTVIREATCSEAGYCSVKCTTCGKHLRYEIISKTEHSPVRKVMREATCSREGEACWQCSVCGTTISTEAIGKVAHSPSVRITKESTCSENGIIETYCTVCGETLGTEKMEKKEHVLSERTALEPTCTSEGVRETYCTVCSEVVGSESIGKKEHTFKRVVIEPTCTEDGSVTMICTLCGYVKKTVRKMLGHVKDSGKTEKTECETGVVYSCTRCGKELERNTKANHSYGTTAYVDENGYHIPCTRCSRLTDVSSVDDYTTVRNIVHVDSVESMNIEAVELMSEDVILNDKKELGYSFYIDSERTYVRFRINGGSEKSNMRDLRKIKITGITNELSEGDGWMDLLLGRNDDVIPLLGSEGLCSFSLWGKESGISLPEGDDVTALLVSFLGYAPGEARGIVFYDKGERSDGWRFLEAAAEDAGKYVWGQNGSVGTADQVGSGKANTALISEKRLKDETVSYAAGNYSENGYKGWFVPSRDELLLMYERLHLNGVGSFSSEKYWSSSAIGTSRASYVDFSNGEVPTYSSLDASRNRSYALRLVRAY